MTTTAILLRAAALTGVLVMLVAVAVLTGIYLAVFATAT